jgi:ubiquinone biosynthesis protein UbiJ
MNPMLLTATLAGLETLINAALEYDPGTRIALANIKGQVLAVSVTTPAMTVYITADDDGVRLMSQWEGPVDTRLHGSLTALAKLARNEHGFVGSGVEVIGSTALLVELQRLLKNLDIDWEDALSEKMGDLAGHQTAEVIRSGMNYTRERTREMNRLLGDFLTEEFKAAVPSAELDAFYQDVDAVRLHLDRLEARINRLTQPFSNSK